MPSINGSISDEQVRLDNKLHAIEKNESRFQSLSEQAFSLEEKISILEFENEEHDENVGIRSNNAYIIKLQTELESVYAEMGKVQQTNWQLFNIPDVKHEKMSTAVDTLTQHFDKQNTDNLLRDTYIDHITEKVVFVMQPATSSLGIQDDGYVQSIVKGIDYKITSLEKKQVTGTVLKDSIIATPCLAA